MLVALTQGRGAGKPGRRVDNPMTAGRPAQGALSLDEFETRLRRRALLRGLGESSPVIVVLVVGFLAFALA